MCDKKYVEKAKKFRNDKRLVKREAFLYPMGFYRTHSVNKSHSLVLRQSLPPLMRDTVDRMQHS